MIPLKDKVLVEVMEDGSEYAESNTGLLLKEGAHVLQDDQVKGRVLGIGPDVQQRNDLKVGAIVSFRKWAGQQLMLPGVNQQLIREYDIDGTWE